MECNEEESLHSSKEEEISREATFTMEKNVKLSPKQAIAFSHPERMDKIEAGAQLLQR